MNPDKLAEYLDQTFLNFVYASWWRLQGNEAKALVYLRRADDCLFKAKVWAERFKMQRVTFQ